MGWFSDAVSSVGDAVSSAASAVADTVEDAVDAVTDTVEDAVDAVVDAVEDGVNWVNDQICDNLGSIVCTAANILLGTGVIGVMDGAREMIHDGLDIVRTSTRIGSAIIRGDFSGAIDQFGNLLFDLFDLGIDALRFGLGGFAVGGAVKLYKRSELRRFVSGLLSQNFGGDRLRTISDRIGLNGGEFGLPVKAYHLRFMLDTANTSLWEWHNDGFIDLYSMAHLPSVNSFEVFPSPRTLVHAVDENGDDKLFPVNRRQISEYLNSKGQKGRFRVYSLTRQATAEKLKTSREKCEQLGIVLEWNNSERFSWFNEYTDHEITSKDEYRFVLFPEGQNLGFERYLFDKDIHPNRPEDDDVLIALGAFRYKRQPKELFGLTAGRNINHKPKTCTTQDRDDLCCNVISRTDGEENSIGSGVIHRDVWPYDVFRYVLVHEIGHFFGLCHIGHNPSEIMFTVAKGQETNWISFGLGGYYWDDEPRFTLKDAKNVWRFIVDQMGHRL